jgi:hypothetical protein
MAQFYFHCSNADEILVDRRGTDLPNLSEAHARALGIAREIAAVATGLDDWRDWLVRVSAADGEEVLLVPFAYALGRGRRSASQLN